MTFTEALRLNARRFPAKPALCFGESSWSYAELYRRVCGMMNALRQAGYGRDDKVAILALNHPDFITAYFALMGFGAVPVPVNYRLSDDDMLHILTHSHSRALLVDRHHLAHGERFAGRVEQVYCLDALQAGEGGRVLSLPERLAAASDAEADLRESRALIMLHTSGTTSRPKGTLREKWGFEERAIEQGFATEDRTLCVMPLCLSAGFGYAMLPLYLGATVYLMESFDAERTLALIDKEKITAAMMFPPLLRRMMESPAFQDFSGRSLRLIQSGGGAVEADLRQAWFAKAGPVLSIYAASTEVGPYANLKGDAVLRYAEGNCIGTVFFGVEVRLLDDDGKEVAVGEVGEICARSSFQYEGYYNDPELTDSTRRGEFFTVGDLGRFDADGYLYFVGRKRDVIKSGGINVYAPEVEEVLASHPAVAEAACIGLPDPEWTELICAVVVLKPGRQANAGELMGFAEAGLARYKRPRRVMFAAELPRNLSGRVMKEKLKKMVLDMKEHGS